MRRWVVIEACSWEWGGVPELVPQRCPDLDVLHLSGELSGYGGLVVLLLLASAVLLVCVVIVGRRG